jgi:hypothetical protein
MQPPQYMPGTIPPSIKRPEEPVMAPPTLAGSTAVAMPELGQQTPAMPTYGGKNLGRDTFRQREQGFKNALANLSPQDPEYLSKLKGINIEKAEYEKQHPYGSPESAKPGLWGKLEHGLAMAGNIAGDVFAPGVMANIPGTQMNRQINEEQNVAGYEAAKKEENEAKKTENEAKALALKQPKNWEEISGGAVDPEHPELGAQQAFYDKTDPTQRTYAGPITAKPKTAEEPLAAGVVESTNKAFTDRYQVLHPGKALPPQYQLPPNATKADFDRIDKQMEQVEKATGTKAQQDTVNQMRKDAKDAGVPLYNDAGEVTGTFNNKTNTFHLLTEEEKVKAKKAGATPMEQRVQAQRQGQFQTGYLKPSTDIEQSFVKANTAYENYKTNPATGASGMVELAMHLGTTLGSVKGAVTGEHTIALHQNAIGVADRLQRWAQSIDTGQPLSASQMKEFNELINASRQVSWQMAAHVAQYRHMPMNFLPVDPNLKIKMVDSSGAVKEVPAPDVQKYADKGIQVE